MDRWPDLTMPWIAKPNQLADQRKTNGNLDSTSFSFFCFFMFFCFFLAFFLPEQWKIVEKWLSVCTMAGFSTGYSGHLDVNSNQSLHQEGNSTAKADLAWLRQPESSPSSLHVLSVNEDATRGWVRPHTGQRWRLSSLRSPHQQMTITHIFTLDRASPLIHSQDEFSQRLSYQKSIGKWCGRQ